ncbi:ABC transporter ATP-binding protein [Planctomycetota bacterium]
MTVLRTIQLTKQYGRHAAVAGLNLEIEQGQIFGFLGPNGAGKSTTIKMMLGLIRPSSGEVSYFGGADNWHDLPIRRRIGALVESPSFPKYLTGRRNLKILSRIYGKVDDADIEDALRAVKLSTRADEPVKNYSLGMKQRLGIAQALLRRPEFLVLDEPTNGLDPVGINDIRLLLIELNREKGVTVFVSSHMLAEVEQLCTHVGFINHGRLLKTGRVRELLAEKSGRVEVTVDDTDLARKALEPLSGINIGDCRDGRITIDIKPGRSDEIAPCLVGAGVKIYELSLKRKNLEDVFLELTVPGQERES